MTRSSTESAGRPRRTGSAWRNATSRCLPLRMRLTRPAPLPATSCCNPGVNGTPAMIFRFGRSAKACGVTPRSVTLAPSVSPLRGSSAITISSPAASGWPCASRRTPAVRSAICRVSKPTVELSSAGEPPRSTITLRGSPLAPNVASMPRDMANSAVNTPTTPAMPITITSDNPRRWGMLRRLIATTWKICLNMTDSSAVSDRRAHRRS